MNSYPFHKVRPANQGETDYPVHGGNPASICEQYGLNPDNLIDFSANINPFGPPRGLKAVIENFDHEIGKYPDPEYPRLKKELSSSLNVAPEMIVLGNGSTELIYNLPRLWDTGKEVGIISPCFSEYERAFALNGISSRKLLLKPDRDFQLELESTLFQLSSWKNLGGIVVGHPNSPAGCLMKPESLLALLHFCEKRELFLIVDETFIEFCDPELSLLKKVHQSRFLILIRSFTKFFAFPGLRLGYAILPQPHAQKLNKYLPPWSVNSIAEQAGLLALKDKAFIESSRRKINVARSFLHEKLNRFKDIRVFPSSANFILFHLINDQISPGWLYTQLLNDGILLRNCWNFDGLSNRFFRIGLRSHADNNKLIQSFTKHLT